jgi:capsule polysaccharide export protein KpsE/RkpR
MYVCVCLFQEDFEYNLKLLEERDEELQNYDTTFANLKAVLRDRDHEISELKVTAKDFESQLKQEQAKLGEMDLFYQNQITELQEQVSCWWS